MSKLVRRALVVGAVAVLGLGASAMPASAAVYPSCTATYSGVTAYATCAATGTSFLFKVVAQCSVTDIFGNVTRKNISGTWTQPGGLSTAKCDTSSAAYRVTWANAMVTH